MVLRRKFGLEKKEKSLAMKGQSQDPPSGLKKLNKGGAGHPADTYVIC